MGISKCVNKSPGWPPRKLPGPGATLTVFYFKLILLKEVMLLLQLNVVCFKLV